MPHTPEINKYFKSLKDWNPVYKQHSITFSTNNAWEIPDLPRYSGRIPKRLIAYSDLSSYPEDADLTDAAIHFYVHDEKFESVWTQPARGLDRVSRTDLAISPDFSVYSSFPLPVQIFNRYRTHWCARLWIEEGIEVIPNVTWSEMSTLDLMLAGIPKRSVIAVASSGAVSDKQAKEHFNMMYEVMLDILEPTDVLFFGNVPKGLQKGGYNLHDYPTRWSEYHSERV